MAWDHGHLRMKAGHGNSGVTGKPFLSADPKETRTTRLAAASYTVVRNLQVKNINLAARCPIQALAISLGRGGGSLPIKKQDYCDQRAPRGVHNPRGIDPLRSLCV